MSETTANRVGRKATLSGDENIELPELDAPPGDPFDLLVRWFRIAEQYAVREPGAVALATADAQGRPSSRIVLLKEIADEALVFTTHSGSRKGRDLAVNPRASLTFYWREMLQQINACGAVELVSEARSDELLAERPPAARATTTASRQSTPLDDEQLLSERAQAPLDTDVSRPAGWAGYRLVPEAIEFWQGRASRLHAGSNTPRPPKAGRAHACSPDTVPGAHAETPSRRSRNAAGRTGLRGHAGVLGSPVRAKRST